MEIVNKIEADYKESKRDQKTDREWEIFVKKMFYAKLSKKKEEAICKKCYFFQFLEGYYYKILIDWL